MQLFFLYNCSSLEDFAIKGHLYYILQFISFVDTKKRRSQEFMSRGGYFLSFQGGSAPVGALKPLEIHRFHWSSGGLAPLAPITPTALLWQGYIFFRINPPPGDYGIIFDYFFLGGENLDIKMQLF